MITSSDSLTTTYRGTKDTICDGTATLLKDGPKDTPNFVTCLNPDTCSVSKLISVRPDRASKSNNDSDAFPSNNLKRTLLDLPREGTKDLYYKIERPRPSSIIFAVKIKVMNS